MVSLRFSNAVVFVLCAASVACGSTIDVGGKSDGAAGADTGAGTDGATSVYDSGSSDAAGDAPETFSSKTKKGVSCAVADLPPAASACSIPGSYEVTESLCSSPDPTCRDLEDYVWTANVTLTGTEVELTNGTDRLLSCELAPPCSCVGKSGDVFHFTSAGFATIGTSHCQGSATQNQLVVGVKQ